VEACSKWNFSREQIEEIKTELARRNVKNSFTGMPKNLICSLFRCEINHIRDLGFLQE
jgi:hypothetical protein